MANSAKKWTQILEAMEVCPGIVIDQADKLSVSSTMSRLLAKGNKEFTLKQSRLTGEVIVVRIK